MNKDRRARINDIVGRLQEIQEELQGLEQEEQEAFDNMPEGLQASDRGQKMEEALGCLSQSAEYVSEAISELENAAEE